MSHDQNPLPGAPALPGCATSRVLRHSAADAQTRDLSALLKGANLRPTQQRLSLARLLFTQGNRHVSAEELHGEALRARMPVSLATVYNTLHQFRYSGLLREVAVSGGKTHFDTNVSDHHHFYIESEDRVLDIETSSLSVQNLPAPPEGMEIARVEVIVRLRKKRRR